MYEQPYECQICNYSCGNYHSFNKHLESVNHCRRYLQLQSTYGYEQFYNDYAGVKFGICTEDINVSPLDFPTSANGLNSIEKEELCQFFVFSCAVNNFFCRLCSAGFQSVKSFILHIASEQHKKRCEMQLATSVDDFLSTFGDLPTHYHYFSAAFSTGLQSYFKRKANDLISIWENETRRSQQRKSTVDKPPSKGIQFRVGNQPVGSQPPDLPKVINYEHSSPNKGVGSFVKDNSGYWNMDNGRQSRHPNNTNYDAEQSYPSTSTIQHSFNSALNVLQDNNASKQYNTYPENTDYEDDKSYFSSGTPKQSGSQNYSGLSISFPNSLANVSTDESTGDYFATPTKYMDSIDEPSYPSAGIAKQYSEKSNTVKTRKYTTVVECVSEVHQNRGTSELQRYEPADTYHDDSNMVDDYFRNPSENTSLVAKQGSANRGRAYQGIQRGGHQGMPIDLGRGTVRGIRTDLGFEGPSRGIPINRSQRGGVLGSRRGGASRGTPSFGRGYSAEEPFPSGYDRSDIVDKIIAGEHELPAASQSIQSVDIDLSEAKTREQLTNEKIREATSILHEVQKKLGVLQNASEREVPTRPLPNTIEPVLSKKQNRSAIEISEQQSAFALASSRIPNNPLFTTRKIPSNNPLDFFDSSNAIGSLKVLNEMSSKSRQKDQFTDQGNLQGESSSRPSSPSQDGPPTHVFDSQKKRQEYTNTNDDTDYAIDDKSLGNSRQEENRLTSVKKSVESSRSYDRNEQQRNPSKDRWVSSNSSNSSNDRRSYTRDTTKDRRSNSRDAKELRQSPIRRNRASRSLSKISLDSLSPMNSPHHNSPKQVSVRYNPQRSPVKHSPPRRQSSPPRQKAARQSSPPKLRSGRDDLPRRSVERYSTISRSPLRQSPARVSTAYDQMRQSPLRGSTRHNPNRQVSMYDSRAYSPIGHSPLREFGRDSPPHVSKKPNSPTRRSRSPVRRASRLSPTRRTPIRYSRSPPQSAKQYSPVGYKPLHDSMRDGRSQLQSMPSNRFPGGSVTHSRSPNRGLAKYSSIEDSRSATQAPQRHSPKRDTARYPSPLRVSQSNSQIRNVPRQSPQRYSPISDHRRHSSSRSKKRHSPSPYRNTTRRSPSPYRNTTKHSSSPYRNTVRRSPSPCRNATRRSPSPYRNATRRSLSLNRNTTRRSSSPYHNSTRRSPSPYRNTTRRSPSPYPNTKRHSPSSYRSTTRRSPSPYRSTTRRSPSSYRNSTRRSPSLYRNTTRRSPSSYRNTTRRSPSPYRNTTRRSPSPYRNTTRRSPSPYRNTTRRSPSPYQNTTRRSRSPYQNTNRRSRSPYQNTTRRSQSSYTSQPSTYNQFSSHGGIPRQISVSPVRNTPYPQHSSSTPAQIQRHVTVRNSPSRQMTQPQSSHRYSNRIFTPERDSTNSNARGQNLQGYEPLRHNSPSSSRERYTSDRFGAGSTTVNQDEDMRRGHSPSFHFDKEDFINPKIKIDNDLRQRPNRMSDHDDHNTHANTSKRTHDDRGPSEKRRRTERADSFSRNLPPNLRPNPNEAAGSQPQSRSDQVVSSFSSKDVENEIRKFILELYEIKMNKYTMANADNLLNSLSGEERKMISGLQQMTGVQDLRQIILSFKALQRVNPIILQKLGAMMPEQIKLICETDPQLRQVTDSMMTEITDMFGARAPQPLMSVTRSASEEVAMKLLAMAEKSSKIVRRNKDSENYGRGFNR